MVAMTNSFSSSRFSNSHRDHLKSIKSTDMSRAYQFMKSMPLTMLLYQNPDDPRIVLLKERKKKKKQIRTKKQKSANKDAGQLDLKSDDIVDVPVIM